MKSYIKELITCCIFALVLYLFYKSWFSLILLIPTIIIYLKLSSKERSQARKAQLSREFKDALFAMAAAMRAGYSLENAVGESLIEMKSLYGSKAPIVKEFSKVINELRLSVPSETAFENMAARSGVEDIKTFAQVFKIAKRTGGNMVDIILKTSEEIAAKTETRNEIDVLVSSKKLENSIMMIMPAAMILYIYVTSSGMLDPLYGNLTGAIIMTVCLAIYAAACLISRKILNIEV